MLIPRVSYFPLVYEKLEKLFARSVDYKPGPDRELWLESEETPLKWYEFVGVSSIVCVYSVYFHLSTEVGRPSKLLGRFKLSLCIFVVANCCY